MVLWKNKRFLIQETLVIPMGAYYNKESYETSEEGAFMSLNIEQYIQPGRRAHLVGIGGVSMSPLGEVLHGPGMTISGSDMNESATVEHLRSLGLSPRELHREVHRKHIFTHIIWNMKGIYLEVADKTGDFQWFTKDEINTQAALPTAFRLFWEELNHV